MQSKIEKKLISIVSWSFSLMALAVLIIAVLSLYIYLVSKLEHAQELVMTKVSTEVSGTLRDINALADSPLLWVALTDASAREVYLEPLLQKINQSAMHKIELLDDRGRPVIDSDAVDMNAPQVQQLITHAVQTKQSKYVIETMQDGQSLLFKTLVVNPPFVDTPLGFLLVSFDLNKLIDTIGLPKGTTVELETRNNLSVSPKQNIWIQQTKANFLVFGQDQTLALHITVRHSALNALLVITFCFVLMLLIGALLIYSLKKWSLGFARTTTARLNPLFERARKKTERKLRELSYNDQLTGMPNYRAFVDHITPLFAHPDKDFSCALIFVDLDNLKMINDKYGHEEGDLVITKLSEHLNQSLPADTFICRRSGDEFIALIHNIQQLPNLLRKLRQLAHTFTLDVGISEPRLIHASFSAGAAIYPGDAQELNGLLTAADMALRVAKETGRAQFVWYSKNIQARAQRLNTIHEKLTDALEKGLIVPHYQPCVELATGRIVGFEALARWTDAELGIMSPGEFIAIAEQTHLINLVTVAILNKVMADKPFIHAHFNGAAIAVNISPHFFVKQEITTFFANHLERDVDCLDGIVLELTESEFLHNPQSIQLHLQLQTLIGMGLKFAIDDFGKGYSSLSRLGSLPFRKLKIDRDFVRDIEDHTNQKIVKSIIALGVSLSLEIIAEGVETALQREALIHNGCHLGQGYLFSKALPLADILKLDQSLASRTQD